MNVKKTTHYSYTYTAVRSVFCTEQREINYIEIYKYLAVGSYGSGRKGKWIYFLL